MKNAHVLIASFVTASVLSAAAQLVTIDTIAVGNPGNAPDSSTGSLYGSVAYDYRIATYEVTNDQYTTYLNAVDSAGNNPNGIADCTSATAPSAPWQAITFNNAEVAGAKYSVRANMGDKPVCYVNWFAAARFTNWLQNGAIASSSTEDGAYTLNGSNPGGVTRSSNATWFIPSENEWYKAAYYEPGASADNYWLYPTRSDTAPLEATANSTGDISNPGTNVANYNSAADWDGLDGNLTSVGTAGGGSASYYGTYDQGGNVREWTEAASGPARIVLGGVFYSAASNLESSGRSTAMAASAVDVLGFRVASIPEPSTVAFLLLSGAGFLVWSRRKAAR